MVGYVRRAQRHGFDPRIGIMCTYCAHMCICVSYFHLEVALSRLFPCMLFLLICHHIVVVHSAPELHIVLCLSRATLLSWVGWDGVAGCGRRAGALRPHFVVEI